MLIRILNHQYAIQGTEDEAYMLKLGTYVEEKMREIQRAGSVVDSHRLAVLTALQIADDYFRLRNRFRELDALIGRKSTEMIRMLDQLTDKASESFDPATLVG